MGVGPVEGIIDVNCKKSSINSSEEGAYGKSHTAPR